MSKDKKGCVQSDRPEDTAAAREEGLTAEDFENEFEESETVPMRRCLTADEILKSEDRNHLDNWVPTPEWGGEGSGVYLLTPTGEDREYFERDQKVERKRMNKSRRVKETRSINNDKLNERLVVRFACDPDGRRLFTRNDVIALRKKASAPVTRIAMEAVRLLGWTDEELEFLEGNSETDQS